MIFQNKLSLSTQGRGMTDITQSIAEKIVESNCTQGLCHILLQHTSASLFINENADPDVRHDLETFMSALVEDGDARFRHILEGEDDMSAHIRTTLTQSELSLPIRDGKLALGTWQGIYLWEHRYQAHQRSLVLTIIGE